MQQLPPLPSTQALRVLDAAVRTRSFTQAAAELGLTRGAVSQQIRSLEQRIGTRLFERKGSHMAPTAAALAAAASTRHALHIIGETFAKPVGRTARQRLRLSTTPAIARFWLTPRLRDMMAATGIGVVILEAATQPIDFTKDEADAALRFGPGNWPKLNAQILGGDRTIAVASPALARALAIAKPIDVTRAPLIANSFMSWRGWLSAAQLPAATPLSIVLETSDSNISLEAAMNGVGVTLTRLRFARTAIANGQLVPLTDVGFDDGHHYYFVWPPGNRKAAVSAAGEWLVGAFSEDSISLGLPAPN